MGLTSNTAQQVKLPQPVKRPIYSGSKTVVNADKRDQEVTFLLGSSEEASTYGKTCNKVLGAQYLETQVKHRIVTIQCTSNPQILLSVQLAKSIQMIKLPEADNKLNYVATSRTDGTAMRQVISITFQDRNQAQAYQTLCKTIDGADSIVADLIPVGGNNTQHLCRIACASDDKAPKIMLF